MDYRAQELLEKVKSAVNNIKCFTFVTEILMYGYVGIVIFGLIKEVFTLPLMISFVLNMCLVLACAYSCEKCRKNLKKTPPNYRDAHSDFGGALCVMSSFAIIYFISAVLVYLYWPGTEAAPLSLLLFVFGCPQLVLALVGFIVIRNFKILLPLQVIERTAAAPRNQVSATIRNDSTLNAGYNRAPEASGQTQDQRRPENPGPDSPAAA